MTPFVIGGVFVKGFIGNVLKGVIKSFFIMPYNFSTWNVLAKVWENSSVDKSQSNFLVYLPKLSLFSHMSAHMYDARKL